MYYEHCTDKRKYIYVYLQSYSVFFSFWNFCKVFNFHNAELLIGYEPLLHSRCLEILEKAFDFHIIYFICLCFIQRSSHWVLFRKMHRKTPVLESLLDKVTDPQAFNFIKKRLQHRCFPVNFAKKFKNTFFTEQARLIASACH